MSRIRNFLETSFIDWPGRVCAVIFLGGCNLRCPFCHNHPLVLSEESFPALALDDVLARLARFKKWLGGVCISGGEPTFVPELPEMMKRLKDAGWRIKLDTNGTRPEVLSRLLRDDLLDMVSMDVKAPLDREKYAHCAGTPVKLENLRKSLALLRDAAPGYEFRMTVVPGFHSEEDIVQWAADLAPYVADGKRCRLKLQNFNPKNTLDPALANEVPFSPDVFARWQNIASGAAKQKEKSVLVKNMLLIS